MNPTDKYFIILIGVPIACALIAYILGRLADKYQEHLDNKYKDKYK